MAREVIEYDPIIAILRSHLLANEQLMKWGSWTDGEALVLPRYLDYAGDAIYPCITICRDYGIRLKNRTGYEESHYFIHGWMKQSTSENGGTSILDDVAFLMNVVKETLDDDPITGKQVNELAMCRMMDSRCPCYSADTRTYFFMTDWHIVASNNIYLK